MIKNTTTQFDFSAKPKVTALKPKYRQLRDTERFDGTSLMNDPRIIRGNTYAAIVQNNNQIQPPPIKRRVAKEARRTQERRINFDTGFQPMTPRAVDGRQHFSIQTQPFVETLRDRPIQYQRECQTDLFLDRPVQREFDPMKQKTGVDRPTQIDENDPELFNFDYQVEPILDALLSKVVETSRMQLYEEQELEAKQKQKNEYQKRRHSRLAEAQKLESKQKRIKQQSQRRNLQFKKSNQQQTFAQKKLISRILSKQYLRNLRSNTNMILSQQGFFRQPLETELYEDFAPWLYQQILDQLKSDQAHTHELLNMTENTQQQMEQETAKWIEKQKQRRKKVLDQKAEKIRLKKQRAEKKKKEKQQELARIKAEKEAALAAQQQAQGGGTSSRPPSQQQPQSQQNIK